MAAVIAKASLSPVIIIVRTTGVGDQYPLNTRKSTDGVPINGTHITCTSHKANCGHVCAVNRRRAACEASFDLSYGDIVA